MLRRQVFGDRDGFIRGLCSAYASRCAERRTASLITRFQQADGTLRIMRMGLLAEQRLNAEVHTSLDVLETAARLRVRWHDKNADVRLGCRGVQALAAAES